MGEQTSIKKTLVILLVVFFVISLTAASANAADGGREPGTGPSGHDETGDDGHDGQGRDSCDWRGGCDGKDRDS